MIWVQPGAAYNPTLPLSRLELLPLVKRVLAAVGAAGAEVEVRLVDDAEMALMNANFLGLPGPTNVLAFPAEDPDRPRYLGEIALSVDTLTREAHLYGQPPEEHFVRLLSHGLLHLVGYDHGPLMEEMNEMAVDMLRSADSV